MPTYTYRCRKCGHTFDEFHGIRDNKPRRCPKCRSRADRVPAGGGGLLFKGTGFHVTDYRSKSYKDRAKQDSSSSGGSSGEPKKPDTPGSGGDSGKKSDA